MKILSIGDIHGRNKWKNIIFGSLLDYDHWRKEADEGIAEFMADQYKMLNDVDKIVFVGDYVDSFDVPNVEMKQNLEDLIHFKKIFPDKVVLLLGNHDIQYIVPDQYCSGYRPEMKYDFGDLFQKNIDLFQMAYYHERVIDGRHKRTLWTHAGVTQGWLRQAKRSFTSDHYKFRDEFVGMEDARPDEILNKMWEYRHTALFNVDADSGGMSQYGGPLWVRPRRLVWEALEGYDQIIGHTPQPTIRTKIPLHCEEAERTDMIDTIYLIDCLEHGDGKYLLKDY